MKVIKHFTLLALTISALTACGRTMNQYPYGYMGYQGQPSYGYSQPSYGYGQQPSYGYGQQVQGYGNNQSATMPATQPLNTVSNQPVTSAPQQQTASNIRRPALSTTTSQPRSTAPQKTVTPKPQAPPSQNAATQAQQFLTQARTAFNNLQSMSATVSTYERSSDEGQGQVRLLFKQPGQVKIDILSSSKSDQKGVKLAFSSGNSQVKVRPSGMLSLVSVNLAMSDPKLMSGRKYRLDQIDLVSTIKRVTQPGQSVKIVGKTQMGSDSIAVLEITSQGHFDPRITRERVGIDMKNHMLRFHEMYEGDTLVYAARVLQVSLNPPLSANSFDV